MKKFFTTEVLKILCWVAVFLAIVCPLHLSYKHAKEKELIDLYGAHQTFQLSPAIPLRMDVEFSHTEFSIYGKPHWHFISIISFKDTDQVFETISCRALSGKPLKTAIGEECPSLISR